MPSVRINLVIECETKDSSGAYAVAMELENRLYGAVERFMPNLQTGKEIKGAGRIAVDSIINGRTDTVRGLIFQKK